MLHMRLALIAASLWLAAVFAAGGAILAFGAGPGTLIVVGGVVAMGVAGTLFLGAQFDRNHRAALREVALAAGLCDRPGEALIHTSSCSGVWAWGPAMVIGAM